MREPMRQNGKRSRAPIGDQHVTDKLCEYQYTLTIFKSRTQLVKHMSMAIDITETVHIVKCL